MLMLLRGSRAACPMSEKNNQNANTSKGRSFGVDGFLTTSTVAAFKILSKVC